jgi:polyether ionophore transport system permease protein
MTAVTAPPAAPAAPRSSGTLTGARELTRLAVRRDRIMLLIWIYALTAIGASGGYALKLVYKTAASRAALIHSVHHDAALSFLYGQLHGSSLGAIAAWRYLGYAALAAGLMSIFLVIRHTRGDEETARLELLGSAVVGRHAPLAVALGVAGLANVVVLVLTTVVLAVSGLPLAGSLAFGLGEVSCGLVAAGIAAIAAQISGTARGARGTAITVIAVAWFLRGVGDSGGSHHLSWLTWLSPIGWAELLQPFGGDRWWVLALPVAATVAGIAAAFLLASHRDQGAGLLPQRPGPPAAGALLAGPLGLSWRLLRASVAGWAAGFLAGGLAIGVVGNGISQLIGSRTGTVAETLTRIAHQNALTDAYLAACLSLVGMVAAGFAVAAVLRLRSEETDGHAEPILSGPVSRLRWAGCQLLVAACGTVVMLVLGGLGMGLGYGLASSTVGTQVPRLVGASLVQTPAALLLGAAALALVGLAPRWSVAGSWAVAGVAIAIAIFGPGFNLARAVLDISPFPHVPALPGGVLTAAPLIWLSACVVVLTAAGLAGLRRRDLG